MSVLCTYIEGMCDSHILIVLRKGKLWLRTCVVLHAPYSFVDLSAAAAAGTSSSFGRIFGVGPSGVMLFGLICLWLLV